MCKNQLELMNMKTKPKQHVGNDDDDDDKEERETIWQTLIQSLLK